MPIQHNAIIDLFRQPIRLSCLVPLFMGMQNLLLLPAEDLLIMYSHYNNNIMMFAHRVRLVGLRYYSKFFTFLQTEKQAIKQP